MAEVLFRVLYFDLEERALWSDCDSHLKKIFEQITSIQH